RLLHRGGRGDRRRALLRRGGRRGRGRRRGAGLLLRERFGRFLLLALLVGDALALELGLAARLLVGGQLLLLRATRDGGLAVGRRLLQARQRRRLGVGLLHRRGQALGLAEVLARDALLGRDQRVGHQVGERAGDGGVVGLLVA